MKESEMRPLKLHSTDLKQICEPVKSDVYVNAYKEIGRLFNKHGINPDYRLNMNISDYPDIISKPFIHRDYTEPCDDMEGFFRANLYHLMHQFDDLLSKYKHEVYNNTENAFIFLFTKPLTALCERISSRLKISDIQCFMQSARYLLYYRIFYHFFHHIINEKSPTAEQIEEETGYLIKVTSFTLTNRYIEAKHENPDVWIKLKAKVFRNMPDRLLKSISDDEIIHAFIECSPSKQSSFTKLLKRLNIEEYTLFESQKNN
jgi:hypothetical protein